MAVFPIASGHPNYGSDGTNQFIPEIWSGKLLKKFYDATVLAAISNTDYEGEIKNQGDTVKIRSIPSITIRNYNKGMNLTYENPESPSVDLLIDKGKYFATVCDRVDKVQSDLNLLEIWAQDASEQMKIVIDEDVLDNIYDDGHADNVGTTAGRISNNINLGTFAGTGISITKANVVDKIVEYGQVLDEQNIPENDRFVIIPAWMATRLKTSDIKDASLTGDSKSPLRNGRIGMIDRFTLYSSNLLYTATDSNTVTCWAVIFGQTSALTFASQITEMETLKAESTFGDLMRGLNVYGYKVIKSEALGMTVAYPG
jgi:hypothetical protein